MVVHLYFVQLYPKFSLDFLFAELYTVRLKTIHYLRFLTKTLNSIYRTVKRKRVLAIPMIRMG